MSRKWKAPYRPTSYGDAIAHEVSAMGRDKWQYFQRQNNQMAAKTKGPAGSGQRWQRKQARKLARKSEVADLMAIIGSNFSPVVKADPQERCASTQRPPADQRLSAESGEIMDDFGQRPSSRCDGHTDLPTRCENRPAERVAHGRQVGD